MKSDNGCAGAGIGGNDRSLGIKSSMVRRSFMSIKPAEDFLSGGHATMDSGE
jgi:hypothetical protein